MPKRWILPESNCFPEQYQNVADALNISTTLAGLLLQRGLTTAQDMDAFLCPGLRHLMQPEAVDGLAEAAPILASALTNGKRLAIWGDYDVDGITSTALLLDFLRERGYDPLWRLPERAVDGYGLNTPGIEALVASADGTRWTSPGMAAALQPVPVSRG